MFRSVFVAIALLVAASPASAEIVSRGENAFTLRFAVGLEASREDVIDAVRNVPAWWDPAHSYTGDAANLSLAFQPGGCWCERMRDGTNFRHGSLVSIEPDRVRFDAPLGPLNGKATRADLIFSAGPENRGTLAAMEFVVEGPGVGAFADAVHGVMQQGWTRYVRFIEYGEPTAED
jgi:hypothetical protein